MCVLFFKQKTAYEMRISDWSSDVCSSDLVEIGRAVDIDVADAFQMRENGHARFVLHALDQAAAAARHDHVDEAVETGKHGADRRAVGEIGRASWRERVCQYG